MRHAISIVPQDATGDDRAAVFEHGEDLVVVLADGSGGSSFAAEAAQKVIDAAARAPVGTDWEAFLAELDTTITRGQTTAVVLEITREGIAGACVGDSGAWLVDGTTINKLTEGARHKPLLGDASFPFPFRGPRAGTLLVASDGLLKYAPARDIARVAQTFDPAALVELVRLPSGGLQDDVSIVLVRCGA